MDGFAKPKFAPKGVRAIPYSSGEAGNHLGMAIQLGGGQGGPSKLGELVRGTMPPRPAAPEAAAPAQGHVGGQVTIRVIATGPDGRQVEAEFDLPLAPGTTINEVTQISA